MNPQLQQFARTILKAGVACLTPAQQRGFKRTYAPHSPDLPTAQVVDELPLDVLDTALQQVQQPHTLLPAAPDDQFDAPAPA